MPAKFHLKDCKIKGQIGIIKSYSQIFIIPLLFFCNVAFSQNEIEVKDKSPASIETAAQDVTVITKEQIHDMHALSVAEVLRKKANLDIKEYGARGAIFSVAMRGFSGNTVAILVDGVQVNSAQNGEFDLTRVNLSAIEKIEIVRGASDAKYTVSGAVGGIINIITSSKNQKQSIMFDVSNLGYFNTNAIDTQKISFMFNAPFSKNCGLNFGVNFINAQNHFEYKNFNKKTTTRTNSNANSHNANALFYANFPNEQKLIITDNFYYQNLLCAGSESYPITANQNDVFNVLQATYSIPYVASDLISTQIQASYKYDKIAYNENSFYGETKSLHTLNSASFINRWDFFAFDFLTINPSVEINIDNLDSNSLGKRFHTTFGVAVSATIMIPNTSLVFYPSVKFVIVQNEFMPIPKIGVSYKLPFVTFTANGYRMFSAPTMNMLYWNENGMKGNENLKSESGWGADLGAQFDFDIKEILQIMVKLSPYATTYRDKIQWASDNGNYMPINIGKTACFGAHAELKADLFSWLSLYGSYDFCKALVLSDGFTFNDNKQIAYTPYHLVSAGLQVKTNGFMFCVDGTWTSLRYISNQNDKYLKPYFLLDFALSYDVPIKDTGVKFEIYAKLRNATNSNYNCIDGYPMPNTSLTIGAKIY